jgi:Flp pilus assembly protein TadD
MKIKPTQPRACLQRLGILTGLDRKIRLDEARELILKAIQLAPRDPFIQEQSRAGLKHRVGNMQEAMRILEAAYKERPDAEIAAHLGEVLSGDGNTDKAGAIWRKRPHAEIRTTKPCLRRSKHFKFKP